MTLFEKILREPIAVMHIDGKKAFLEGPDTYNLYRLTLESGPDLSTDRLLAVVTSRGLSVLAARCVSLLASPDQAAATRTMRAIGDPFLASYEWNTIRMRALVKYGAKCSCCGKTAKDGVVINVDHIQPRRTHPELALDIENLQILCAGCNLGKGNWDSTDWRKERASA